VFTLIHDSDRKILRDFVRFAGRRLRDNQISAAELATLRADHAALPRLWSELETLPQKPPTATP
jgi:NADPH-dependent ferric siderophore reductase